MTLTQPQLEAGLDHIRAAPANEGRLELIVARPARDERSVLERASLDEVVGLVGDMWQERPSTSSPDGGPHPSRQITIMNARAISLIAG
ncbi:MAG TPA: MOSC domain-containing protein, partial [Acidimicrobiia bacterium]|nr:MOSC domain-containing protein [Acidimicrobiia bacterium]